MVRHLKEATITINGAELTAPQSMTLRVALTIFMMEMDNIESMLRDGYLAAGREMLHMMQETKQDVEIPK